MIVFKWSVQPFARSVYQYFERTSDVKAYSFDTSNIPVTVRIGELLASLLMWGKIRKRGWEGIVLLCPDPDECISSLNLLYRYLSNLLPLKSRLCETLIPATIGWIYPITSSLQRSTIVVVQRHNHLGNNLLNLVAAGSRLCEIHISQNAGQSFSIWSSLELLRPVVMQHYGPLAIWYELAHGHISLKPLVGFSPFKVLRHCLDLELCSIMVICPLYGVAHCCPLDPYGLVHRLECISLSLLSGFRPLEVSWNRMYLWLCTIMGICSFDLYGFPMGQSAYSISETAGRICSVRGFMELLKPVNVQHHGQSPICSI